MRAVESMQEKTRIRIADVVLSRGRSERCIARMREETRRLYVAVLKISSERWAFGTSQKIATEPCGARNHYTP